MSTAAKKCPTVAELAREAAVLALNRLKELLLDPDTSNADVLKASQLIFDRAYAGEARDAPGGDYDIIVKEK